MPVIVAYEAQWTEAVEEVDFEPDASSASSQSEEESSESESDSESGNI